MLFSYFLFYFFRFSFFFFFLFSIFLIFISSHSFVSSLVFGPWKEIFSPNKLSIARLTTDGWWIANWTVFGIDIYKQTSSVTITRCMYETWRKRRKKALTNCFVVPDFRLHRTTQKMCLIMSMRFWRYKRAYISFQYWVPCTVYTVHNTVCRCLCTEKAEESNFLFFFFLFEFSFWFRAQVLS